MTAPVPNMWQLLSDMDTALAVAQTFADAYTEYPGPTALVGDSARIVPVAQAKQPRARHAASIGAAAVVAPEPETVFAIAARTRLPVDLQWAVMTAIAVDAPFRDAVAVQCPPAAAALVRSFPARFERYVMGASPGTMIMTPHQAVVDFALRVEATFTNVSVTTA